MSAKWQLDAAMLSRPVDLTPLVTMSRTHADHFLEDKTLHRLVTLLNDSNENKSNRDTKLDILNILANVALSGRAVSEVRAALQGVSEWFDQYISQEESIPGEEPELNKIMVLLLARCWDYKLKTEDVLELTQGNRKIALCTTVGLLEDGETYSTELRQKQKPSQGKMGQWEHELVCQRYEKPLMLQICRLLRGFTHPGTYFEASEQELALFSVERFADEMDTLLEITLRSNLVEKLSKALYKCLFEDEDEEEEIDESKLDRYGQLEEYDHIAVASVHAFLQNLYFYSTQRTEEFRRHLLMETLLIPRLILPYLDRCVIHATILNTRAEAYRDMLEGDMVAEMALHNPQLVKGMAASLRTLIIASFRAPSTQFVMTLLRRLNPTSQILRASAFCRYHDYIFALICMLNINMGALDISRKDGSNEDAFALEMLQELAQVYFSMDREKQARVVKRLMYSGALPLSRDTSSYATMMSVVDGGFAGQFNYADAKGLNTTMTPVDIEDQEFVNSRAEAKRAHLERLSYLRRVDDQERAEAIAEVTAGQGNVGGAGNSGAEPKVSAFQIAVSVANASDSKSGGNAGGDSKNLGGESKANAAAAANKFRLLGDLPSLGGGGSNRADAGTLQQDAEVALNLELHKNKMQFMKNAPAGADAKEDARSKVDANIPREFLCAINGHVMKDPVRSNRTGLVYERATIELWLATRGAVCPITNEPLEKSDLVPEDELRTRIKRYHIQQMTMQRQASTSVGGNDDDLYDF